jgi:hypothetical protein
MNCDICPVTESHSNSDANVFVENILELLVMEMNETQVFFSTKTKLMDE